MNTKTDFCPYSKKCGGCQLTNMTYPEQLSFKQVKCIRELGKFGHVDEIIGMDEPFHYRNKVQAAFGFSNGKIISGVFQSSSHRIVNVDSCRIEDEKADEIIVTIRKMLPNFKLTAYNEDSGRGFLRHVLVKRGFSTNEIMVVLVTPTALFTNTFAICGAHATSPPCGGCIATSGRSIGRGFLRRILPITVWRCPAARRIDGN